jgi:hypothetical protein
MPTFKELVKQITVSYLCEQAGLDEKIAAVICMQREPWSLEKIADEVLQAWPTIEMRPGSYWKLSRETVLERVTEFCQAHDLTDQQMEQIEASYPDVFELMEKNRTMTFGEAMVKLGHMKPESKH